MMTHARAPLCAVTLALLCSIAAAQGPARLELIAEGLNAPIFLTAPDDGSGRRFVGEQRGMILILDRNDRFAEQPWLDLRDAVVPLLPAFDERGLLALALHPAFADNGRLFVNYSAPRRQDSPFTGETAYTWRLSEFRVSRSDPNRVARDSELVLLEIDWVNRKHNGGGLAFGSDGLLYVGVGDGGGVHGVPDVYVAPPLDEKDAARHAETIPEDPFRLPARFHHHDRYAQDLSRLQGKILRLDVDRGTRPYAIPATNPLRAHPGARPEIYAWGFRNPFRLTFDRAGNGDMFVSGVAESFWETIFLVDRPGNYGWAIREGSHCFDRARMFDPPRECANRGALGEPLRGPIVEYANWSVRRRESTLNATPLGTASVGGILYRGEALPALRGKLIVGDFSATIQSPSGQLFVAAPPAEWRAPWALTPLLQIDARLHSLGEDSAGELYALTTAHGIPVGESGRIWKLVRP